MVRRKILHLCADTGSDSKPWKDAGWEVILVGSDIGVENYTPPQGVYGIIANPVCTEFSTARPDGRARNPEAGMKLVRECQRIIKEAGDITFWAIENPATGALKDILGKPQFVYQPWEYGSPWTKKTALWGKFRIPPKTFSRWEDVPKIPQLYQRPGRGKPSLAFMHKSQFQFIPEFAALPMPKTDAEFRSLCSQGFAQAFYEVNKCGII